MHSDLGQPCIQCIFDFLSTSHIRSLAQSPTHLVSLANSYLWKPLFFMFPFISSPKCEHTHRSPDLSSSRFEGRERKKKRRCYCGADARKPNDGFIMPADYIIRTFHLFERRRSVIAIKRKSRVKMRDAHTDFASMLHWLVHALTRKREKK